MAGQKLQRARTDRLGRSNRMVVFDRLVLRHAATGPRTLHVGKWKKWARRVQCEPSNIFFPFFGFGFGAYSKKLVSGASPSEKGRWKRWRVASIVSATGHSRHVSNAGKTSSLDETAGDDECR